MSHTKTIWPLNFSSVGSIVAVRVNLVGEGVGELMWVGVVDLVGVEVIIIGCVPEGVTVIEVRELVGEV
jgi:hypothetical protein